MSNKLSLLGWCSFLALPLFACSEVEETLDCGQICTRYDECRSEIDVGDCVDSCENVEDDSPQEQRLEECEECVTENDLACAEIDHCWDDVCRGVFVPIAD